MGLGAIGAVGALASAGSSIAGGIMGGNAAKKAAGQEASSIQQGINYLQSNYNTTASNLQPFIGGGTQAMNTLLGFYGLGPNPQGAQAGFNQFQQTPFYQFPFQQGMLGVNRALAASGLIGSGAALKEGAQFAQGLASSGLGTYLSGLSGLAGSGQNAATSLGQIGAGVGQNVLGATSNQGLALGGGITGSNNALQQGFQNAFGPLSTFGNNVIGGGTSSTSYGGLNNFLGNLFGYYSGPSNNTMMSGSGTPQSFQQGWGVGANQYVP